MRESLNIVLAIALAAMSGCTADSQKASSKTSVPEMARLGRIEVGFSTQEDLAKQWGQGKVITGGHPNSGRLWRVKGTPWVLHTDGFEYSKRGLVVDGLRIYEETRPEEDVPDARLSRNAFVWLGGISLGLTKDKVMEVLKRKSLPFTPTKDGCEVSANGFHALENNVRLKLWRTTLVFSNETLIRLTLDAGE